MVKLTGSLANLKPSKILVAGDLMLDSYIFGKASRISPEAPVPILKVSSEKQLPGGAGNVLLNLSSLGFQPIALGRVGYDKAGDELKEILQKEGVDVRGVISDRRSETSIKQRIIADNQQMIRLDREEINSLSIEAEMQAIRLLPELLEGVSAIALSDYGKGFLTDTLIKEIVTQAALRNIIIIADPKGRDFQKYSGVSILKPNKLEAYQGASLDLNEPLEKVAEFIFEKIALEWLVVTRSEEGISAFSRKGERIDFPVISKQIKDVTGAGDTVLAMMTASLGSGLTLKEAISLSNVAAGLAIETIGCAKISLGQMAFRLTEFDSQSKIYEEEHLFALKAALLERPFQLLALEGNENFSTDLFSSLQELTQVHKMLVIYIKNDNPCRKLLTLLASLEEVTFIVIKKHTLHHVVSHVKPAFVFDLNKGALNPLALQDLLHL